MLPHQGLAPFVPLLALTWTFLLFTSIYAVDLKPTGIMWDVEPHALREWDSDMVGTANQWLDFITEATKRARTVNLRTAVAIPFWYDGRQVLRNGVTKSLLDWTLEATDEILVMGYRDHAQDSDGIIQQCQTEVEQAQATGKKVTIAVEVDCDVTPEKVTFCEEGSTVLERELALVHSHFSCFSAFTGVAIHYYKAWKSLSPSYTTTSTDIPRDVFAWATSDLAYAGPKQDEAMQFFASHRVRNVYLGLIAITLREQVTIARLLNTTASYNLGLELLYGKHTWALQANHADGWAVVDAAVTFMKERGDYGLNGVTVTPASPSSNNANAACASTMTSIMTSVLAVCTCLLALVVSVPLRPPP